MGGVVEQIIKKTYIFSASEIKAALNIPEAEELLYIEKRNDTEIRAETKEVKGELIDTKGKKL